jgi:hypothetical protein
MGKHYLNNKQKSNPFNMSNAKFLFWQRMLTYANIVAVFVGLVVAFAGNSVLLGLHNAMTREVFFDNAGFAPDVLKFKNWLFGIIGATVAGFHILMIMISEHAFKKKEKWAYNAMWYGLLLWFVIDSGISFYYSALHNLWIINIPAFIMISIPLIATRKEFSGEKLDGV